MMNTYTALFYVNGYLTSRVERLSPNEAYNQVPGEALNQVPGSRWHAMLRGPALERLDALLAGESIRVCWQDPSQDNWSDTEHLIITKDPVGIHFQAPVAAPAPVPAPVQGLHMNLLNDIQALINNMIMNQDNQQNLINNIRNRLSIMNNPNPNLIQNNYINPNAIQNPNANGFQG